jgi:hypothetical protein
MGNTFKFIFEYKDYIENIENKSDKDNYIYNEILKRSKFGKISIFEGLIFTHPLVKSVNILKKRFPELLIEIKNDGEIYIENQLLNKLNNYLPIITNLGYFISLYTIDGSNWLKEYSDDTNPIAFYLEPKYDLKVPIHETLYHSSPIKYKDKISKIGFIPKTGNKISNHPERIYLTDDLNSAISFGENIKKETKSGYCVYKINGKCIDNLYSDINLRSNGYYTLQNIKPGCFELIKEISY